MQHADTVLVFFVYGLASFAMGLVIVVELRRARPSPLAASLRYLAAFGLLHGLAQWVVMAQLVKTAGVTVEGSVVMRGLFVLLSALAALALLGFGASLLASTSERLRWVRWLPWGLVAAWAVAVVVPQTAPLEPPRFTPVAASMCVDCHLNAAAYLTATRDVVNGLDIVSRYLLLLPACLLAAVGLARQSQRFRATGLPRLDRYALFASGTFVATAAVAGLVVPPGPYFPASAVNYATVSDRIGFAPQLLWVAVAGALAVFVVRMLGVFEIERQRQLQAAVVEERERIGREMHDGLAQALGYVGLRSSLAREVLDRRDIPRAKELVESIRTATDDAYRDVRASILELRTSDASAQGLRRCVEEYCEKFELETGIAVRVRTDESASAHWSPLVELQVIRIVQEALANVRKHAHARQVTVRLAWKDTSYVVTVSDDGRGFALADQVKRPGAHFGLQTMRERAESLGGTLRIETAPGRGTNVSVTIPHSLGTG